MCAKYALPLLLSIFSATDVQEVHQWMVDHFTAFPLFQRVSEREEGEDPIVPLLTNSTEEAKKVERSGGAIYIATFQRVRDPYTTSGETALS